MVIGVEYNKDGDNPAFDGKSHFSIYILKSNHKKIKNNN
jgi:hypothetical protein